VDGQKDIETAAVRFDHFVDRMGYTPEQAARKMVEMETPEYQAKVKGSLKAEDIDKRLRTEITNGTLMSSMSSLFAKYKIGTWAVPGTRPAIEANPEAREVVLQDFASLVKEEYLRHGDYGAAQASAAKQLSRIWGVTNTSGGMGGTFMRYPPENAPVFHGIPDVSAKLVQQARMAIKTETGQDVPANRIKFLPMLRGQTSTPYLTGETPPYKLMWSADGIKWDEKSGFVADVEAMREAEGEARRAGIERVQTDDQRRKALSETRRQQRRATNVLDEPVTDTRLPEAGGGGGY
jgi:hypothetical protein